MVMTMCIPVTAIERNYCYNKGIREYTLPKTPKKQTQSNPTLLCPKTIFKSRHKPVPGLFRGANPRRNTKYETHNTKKGLYFLNNLVISAFYNVFRTVF